MCWKTLSLRDSAGLALTAGRAVNETISPPMELRMLRGLAVSIRHPRPPDIAPRR